MSVVHVCYDISFRHSFSEEHARATNTPRSFFSRGSTISTTTCISSTSWGSPHVASHTHRNTTLQIQEKTGNVSIWHSAEGGLDKFATTSCLEVFATCRRVCSILNAGSLVWPIMESFMISVSSVETNMKWDSCIAVNNKDNSIKVPEAISQWAPMYLIFSFPFIPEFDMFLLFVPHRLSLQLYYVSQAFHSPFRKV